MSKKNHRRKSISRHLPVKVQARIYANLLVKKAELESGLLPAPIQEPFALIINDLSLIKVSQLFSCLSTNDLSSLVMSGEPNQEQLQKAWLTILSQFYDAKKDAGVFDYIQLVSGMIKLEVRMNRVQRNIEALRIYVHPAIVDELKADGYTSYRYTEATIAKDLERITTSEKKFKIYHQRLSKQYEERYGHKSKNKAIINEADLYEEFDILRQFGGYNIPPEVLAGQMTGVGYCALYCRYIKHVEQQNLKAQKDGRQPDRHY